jgi:hypothetical protein
MPDDWGACNAPACSCDCFLEPELEPNALWCSRCGHIFHLHLRPYTSRPRDNESEVLAEAPRPA